VSEKISESETFSFLSSRRIYSIMIVALMISIVTVGYVLTSSSSIRTESLPVVEVGDMVYVTYVGYFSDHPGDWVFDTSDRTVAMNNNIAKSLFFVQREPAEYKPLNFTAGTAVGLLEPFVQGVVGMTVTQMKRIDIPIEEGYPIVEQYIRTNYIDMRVPVIFNMSISEFESSFGVTPTVGLTIDRDKNFWEWDSTVFDITGDKVIVQHEPYVGMRVSAFGDPDVDPRDGWYQEVISIDPSADGGNGLIIVRNQITAQDIYQKKGTDYDRRKFTLVNVDETNGTFSYLLNEQGYIGELAGRSLYFEVTISRVLKN